MVSTRKKDYGEPAPKKKHVPPKVIEEGDPKRPNTPNQIPCVKFSLFPKLPPELRLEVWKMSMTPRLVVVEPKSPWYNGPSKFGKKILPSHFSINSEAREYALRHYSLRFTVTVIVDLTGRHNWYCHNFRGIRYHANAIMSPDDTLGLIGWETLPCAFGWKFGVESADSSGPWASKRPNVRLGGMQPKVTKVAFLAATLRSGSNAIDVLNRTVSGDLTQILHTKSDKLRKLLYHEAPGYTLRHRGYFKDHVLMHSRNFNGTLQEWGERLMYRIKHRGLAESEGLPDILAFELGKQPGTIYVPQAAPASLPRKKSWEPEDLYFDYERRWLSYHYCPRGF